MDMQDRGNRIIAEARVPTRFRPTQDQREIHKPAQEQEEIKPTKEKDHEWRDSSISTK